MSVFNNLLYLYKKSGASTTPMEDFCTECLAGILRSEDEILYDFIRQVLQIKSDSIFKVSTQRTYYTKDGKQGRVDLVLESKSELCFVEIKVISGEQEGQLDMYDRILSEHPKLTYLRYCTLYIDDKNNLDDFYQFRWADIARFMVTKSEKNSLIREFYNFLKENHMTGNERFNHEELVGLKVYGDITLKIMEVFSMVTPGLKEKFGTVSGGLYAPTQIKEQNRWAIYCKNILGTGDSEILISFDFKGYRYEDEPVVAVQLFVHARNDSYKNLSKVAHKYYQHKNYNKGEDGKNIFLNDKHGNGAHIRFEKPLALFFSEDEQLKSIQAWIEDKLDKLMEFKNQHPDLDWNFGNKKEI